MYKKMLSLLIAVSLIMSLGLSGFALAKEVNGVAQIYAAVNLNGNKLDANALVIGGTVYLPVRSVCEELGFSVEWTGTDNKEIVTAINKSETVNLDIVNKTIAIDEKEASMTDNNGISVCFLNNGRAYLNSEWFSKAFCVDVQYDATNSTVTLKSVPEQRNVDVKVGGTFAGVFNSNPTTGYNWYYTIGDSSIIENTVSSYTADSKSAGIVGAGGKYNWTFKALKAGATTITFKYYRTWLGESSATAADTVIYTVTVK